MTSQTRAMSLVARTALILAGLLPAIAGAAPPPAPSHQDPRWLFEHGIPLERVEDPPVAPFVSPLGTTGATRAASTIPFGRFTIIQVNVNGVGADIVGDAANEPSLVVNPSNHSRMVIGWRQFDTIASNFRQAGFGYTTNAGATWTTGKIQPGVFRSDPVLDTDGSGIFYNSLGNSGGLHEDIFRSNDGGATWGPAVPAFGGDKQWMAVDRSIGHLYQAWSIAGNAYGTLTFDKSVDDGNNFQSPTEIPDQPIWGTLDVGLDHTLYVAGWGTAAGSFTGEFRVARSTNVAFQPSDPASFTSTTGDLGGFLRTGPPNGGGLLGQAGIAVDRSSTPRFGWVYVLSSVQTPTDPLDVNFIRSMDNGQTWTAPVRVNDDPAGDHAFQWFGTMSVSPSGRIDAVWNDTRGSADSTVSAVYYSYSTNGGANWSPNEQVTPTWNSTVGYPNQSKIGDYYDMTSDDAGADLAFAATFNGGEDIYYVRIPNAAVPTGVGDHVALRPRRLESFPNPFREATTIRFDAPRESARVRLEVFDLSGRRVATLVDGFRMGSGLTATWDGRREDGSEAPPSVYLCRLQAGAVTETRRLLRVR